MTPSFFVKPKKECEKHLPALGWHLFSTVIKGNDEYWVPPMDEEESELSEEDANEDDSGGE